MTLAVTVVTVVNAKELKKVSFEVRQIPRLSHYEAFKSNTIPSEAQVSLSLLCSYFPFIPVARVQRK